MKKFTVPTFAADGSPRREYSIEAALYLESRKTLYLQRRGAIILYGHWYGESGMPLQNRLRAGTRYSYKESCGDRRAWTLQKLPVPPVVDAITAKEFYAELAYRQSEIFLSVPRGCLRKRLDVNYPQRQ